MEGRKREVDKKERKKGKEGGSNSISFKSCTKKEDKRWHKH